MMVQLCVEDLDTQQYPLVQGISGFFSYKSILIFGGSYFDEQNGTQIELKIDLEDVLLIETGKTDYHF